MKKTVITKAQKIRDYIKENPTATDTQIAKAIGCSEGYVWIAKNNYKPDASKKKVAKKKVISKKSPMTTDGQMILRRVLAQQPTQHDTQHQNQIIKLTNEIEVLNDQIHSYRAVVNYLEFKLGIRDGLTV